MGSRPLGNIAHWAAYWQVAATARPERTEPIVHECKRVVSSQSESKKRNRAETVLPKHRCIVSHRRISYRIVSHSIVYGWWLVWHDILPIGQSLIGQHRPLGGVLASCCDRASKTQMVLNSEPKPASRAPNAPSQCHRHATILPPPSTLLRATMTSRHRNCEN